jgi:hypothetical protein
MRPFLLFFCFLLSCSASKAQLLIGVSSKWDDSFAEWNIETDNEKQSGTLTQRWASRNDWTEWDFQLGDASGSIRQKFKNDPTHWELRCNNKIVSLKMLWRNDPSQWEIADDHNTYTFHSKFRSNPNEWLCTSKQGDFSLAMYHQNDPRDWEIDDDMDENVPLEIKIAMLFVGVFNSFPR